MCRTELEGGKKALLKQLYQCYVLAAKSHNIKSLRPSFTYAEFSSPLSSVFYSVLLLLEFPLLLSLLRRYYSEWAETDPKDNIPVFLSVVAVPITSRSHGKDRKVKVKVMSITGRFLGPVSTCRFVVSAGLPPERP